MEKYGLTVETFQAAGRFQHKVYKHGISTGGIGKISNDVEDALKRANELLWEEMPTGAMGLKITIEYKLKR